ncbi:MAG: hypothetical protein LBS30_02210 [Planctomycetota bacterium]|jgi:hypothetical protein|nr:hypothetical protein [Planctomycetota bacterium]
METIITVVIVGVAALWFFRWFNGVARGGKGCSCGNCGKKDCLSRTERE